MPQNTTLERNLILFAVAVKLKALIERQGTATIPAHPVAVKNRSDPTDTAATSQVQQANRQYLFKRITRTRNDNRKVAK
jgi:hypothetical protein